MIAKLNEIESVIDKLESVIKTLREERDSALNELALVKKTLDEREIELLQMDEEMQREIKRFEDEQNEIAQERLDAEQRLEKIAIRIRELVPLLPEREAPVTLYAGGSQTTIDYSED
jgi:chromosome segregation ATPase